jgi:hypothetical protein
METGGPEKIRYMAKKGKILDQGTDGCGVEGGSDLLQCDSMNTFLNNFTGVHLEKLTDAQLVKKIRIFDVTLSFIAAFTRARHWYLSGAS